VVLSACGGGSSSPAPADVEIAASSRLVAFSVETALYGLVYFPAFEWFEGEDGSFWLVDERGVRLDGGPARQALVDRGDVIREWEGAGLRVLYWLEEEWLVNADLVFRSGFALDVWDWNLRLVVDRAVWLVAGT